MCTLAVQLMYLLTKLERLSICLLESSSNCNGFFSERSLYAVARPSVCLSVCLSVTPVHPTQAVVIFGNFSMALGTLAIHSHMSFRLVPKSVTLND